MTVMATLKADTRKTEPGRIVRGRIVRGRIVGALSAVAIAVVLACAAPAAVSAANAPVGIQGHGVVPSESPRKVAFLGINSPALTPGLPPPQIVAHASDVESGMSTRTMAAGMILVLFAGLAALTATMWRDLARRVGVR
jgi:hypothetical protein